MLCFCGVVNAQGLEANVYPANVTVTEGESVSFGCTAEGGIAPYNYSWVFDDVNTNLTGASFMVSSGLRVALHGASHSLYCMVTDSLGVVVMSNIVSLTLVQNTSITPNTNATPTPSPTENNGDASGNFISGGIIVFGVFALIVLVLKSKES